VSERPTYAVRVSRNVRIPTGQLGLSLAADLHLPDTPGPVPALVSVQPYRKDAIGGIGATPSLHWFAAHGYASMLVDSCGTGSSDGAPRPPFDPGEADDGVAAVEWAARQPWCTGAVGMWGMSYGAVMSLRAASRGPAGLKAIISLMGTPDPGEDFIHPGGSRGCLAPLGLWSMSTLLSLLLPPLGENVTPAEEARWRERLEHAEPYLLDLHRHGPGHPVWRSRAIDVEAIAVPALCVAGWRDMFCDGSIRAFERISGFKKLLAGPWMHTPPHESPFDPADFHGLALRWWDRWLAGIRNGADTEPAVTIFIQGERAGWRHVPVWPPAVEEVTLTAGRDGTGGSSGDGTGPPANGQAVTDPHDGPIVGALSGLWFAPTTGYGLPLDQHDDDMNSITFTGPPLGSPLTLAGRPAVSLSLPAARRDPRLVVKLTDLDPQGRSTLITTGLLSVRQPGGGIAPRWPGGQVTLGPTAYCVAAGHRLRVVISEDDFPRLWPAHPVTPGTADGRFPGPADAEVTLTLPVLSPAEERPARVPLPREAPPGRPGLGLHYQPRWTIARNLLNDAVTVTIGEDGLARTPSHSHELEWRSEITGCGSAASADVGGTCTATARTGSGATITTRIAIHVTETAATATGNVSINGAEAFSRRWEHPGPGSQADPAVRVQRSAHEPSS
jgi:uncharacterized protein